MDAPYRYTGQKWEENDALEVYYYRAHWYDPALRRFLQPDTIVPEPGNPQSLNRYAYGLNNPVKYTDPTGHWIDLGDGFGVRQNENGWYTILYGGSEFRNYVEIALANIIMNGGSPENYDLPVASGPASERTLAAVGVELGYEAANPLIDQLLDPNLFAGVACLAGDFVDDGVGAVLQGASRAKGFVPNPNGRKGGAAHQAEVKWVEDDVRNRGFETIREFPVRIEKPDGTRTYRYIDVAAIDKQSNRPVEFHQVGRLTASGQPVSREWRVFSELSMYGGDYSDVPTWFHGYQP